MFYTVWWFNVVKCFQCVKRRVCSDTQNAVYICIFSFYSVLHSKSSEYLTTPKTSRKMRDCVFHFDCVSCLSEKPHIKYYSFAHLMSLPPFVWRCVESMWLSQLVHFSVGLNSNPLVPENETINLCSMFSVVIDVILCYRPVKMSFYDYFSLMKVFMLQNSQKI